MHLEILHAMVRDLARRRGGAGGTEWSGRLSATERAAVRALRERLREAVGFAGLMPVSGSSIWMAPPLREQAE